jgi:regulator of sigma E protease
MVMVIISLLAFLLAIGLLVTVHEFGHYWVARKNGVLVKRFSIGFGKALWQWRDRHGTEFVIAAIPLGGYVRMLDSRVDPVLPEFRDLALDSKSVKQRMAIVAAGPIANFILAFLLLWVMYIIGIPSLKPVIDYIEPGSIAAQAQLQPQQQIIAVNDEEADDWQAIQLLLLEQIGQPQLRLTTRDLTTDSVQHVELNLADWQFDPEQHSAMSSLGIIAKQATTTLQLATVEPNSAAAKAGLQTGDTIVAFAGVSVTRWSELVNLVQNHANKTVEIEFDRQGNRQRVAVTPASRQDKNGFHQGFLGVMPVVEPVPEELLFTKQYNPLAAVVPAMEKCWQLVRLTFSMLGKLLVGDVSVQHLSGPVTMAQSAGVSVGLGLIAFLSYLALISVNLGVVNLLPLPILDGGHLMYLVVELIRGKPVSERAQELGFKFGALVLLTLMGIALLNDISRL